MTDSGKIENLSKQINIIEKKIDAIMAKFEITLPEPPKKEPLPYIPPREFKMK